ncbi:hypothetical protein PPYR_11157 [Photinus pyralis]|uniref:DDE Tnp4 domain-containing protein n=1 Tax=Photinus pyralis TaxID=7054 RepID=A0A5N4AAN1_PHOPY|nr:hypothetical protein PPYR_11157 [Photinus pyralis]
MWVRDLFARRRQWWTLRFLATGDSYPSLSFAFRIAPSTICNIIKEVCIVLWQILSPLYLKPMNKEKWISIINDFYNIWQLPNCMGSIDGKHVRIHAPSHSGSLYVNYKNFFSIVLLAVCDARYSFTYVDVGAYGSQSDGGILKNSIFGKRLLNGTLGVPQHLPLPNTEVSVPTFFVGDEGFPLQVNLLRPYSKRKVGAHPQDELIFNYSLCAFCRLSRARRVIENTFGIMVARFRIFHRNINAEPQTVDGIIKAAVCLHNFIKSENSSKQLYCNSNFIDREENGALIKGDWRKEVPQQNAFGNISEAHLRFGNRNSARNAWSFRNYIKDYLNNPEGSDICPWQCDHIQRTE